MKRRDILRLRGLIWQGILWEKFGRKLARKHINHRLNQDWNPDLAKKWEKYLNRFGIGFEK